MDRELFWKTLNLVLVIGTAIGIIYPAFLDPNVTLTRIIVSLFEPDLSLGFVSRWLIVLLFLASLYAIIVGRVYRRVPITVLSSAIEIKYLSPDGSRVLLRKEQTLRANQRNVTAIFNSHATTSSQGRMPKDSVNVSIYADAVTLDDRKEIYGQESRSLEVIHIFGKPLPYAWFMPVIPIWLLSADYDHIPRLFRKYVVRRTNSVIYENEFNFEPVMRFTTEAYPTFNVVITIDFSLTNMPPRQEVRAMRMKNHGVTIVAPEYISTEKKLVFRLNEMRNERLLITWSKPAVLILPATSN